MPVSSPPSTNRPPAKKKREWAPHLWHGMHAGAWWSLLARNRFDVDWRCAYVAAACSITTPYNSVCRWLTKAIYGRRVAATPIDVPPLVIVGHWRSGTTLLHELLTLDPRHTYVTTYECHCPSHFLLTDWLGKRLFGWVLPEKRPMDNMAVGWDRPQEDEFALLLLGEHSPYRMLAFPNRPLVDQEYLTLDQVPPADREHWKRSLRGLLQAVTLKRPGRRIVLKSPPHTARIAALLELFPEARFVHIVRDPFVVFPSTVNLWKKLSEAHGLQWPRHEHLEEYVLDTFVRMYEAFERDRPRIPAGHFHEVRYEELVADPIGAVRTIYERLSLGPVEPVLPQLEKYQAESEGYQTNRWQLTPEQRERIRQRWSAFLKRYGYTG